MYGQDPAKGKRKATADAAQLHGQTWYFKETPKDNAKRNNKKKQLSQNKSKNLKNAPSNSMTSMASSSKSKAQGSKLNVTPSKSQLDGHKHKKPKCPRKSKKKDGGTDEGPSNSQSNTQMNNGKRVNYNPNLVEFKSFTSLNSGAGGGRKRGASASKSKNGTLGQRSNTDFQSGSNLESKSRNGRQGGRAMNGSQGNSRSNVPSNTDFQSRSNLESESKNGRQGGRNRSQGNSRSNVPSNTDFKSRSNMGQQGGRGMNGSQGPSRSNLQSRSQSQMSMKSKKTKSQSRMATQTASSISQYSQVTTMTGGEGGGGGCGGYGMGNDLYSDATGNRLMVHQKTNIDVIKDSIPKPEGYLPPRFLPTWEEMPMEQRLPLLPAPPGVLFFTRGDLGKTLLRKNVIYSMDDPLNRVRVPSDKYEELHDPQNQLDKSVIARDYLMNSGTVNEYGEVICTLKEFNRYRRYLASLHSEQVREKIKDLDELRKMEAEHKKVMIKEEMMTKGEGRQAIREDRVAYAKEFIKMREEQKLKKFLRNQAIEERRCVALQQEKRDYQAFLVELNRSRKKMQMKRMKEQNKNEEDRARIVLHDYTLKEMRAAANKQHVDKNRKIIQEQKDACWFDAKILSAAERLERENEIRAEYSETLKKRAVRRQKNVEKFRSELPLRIAKNKEAAERLDQIVRKYFYRWWDKVRARLSRRVDEDHESVFYSQKRDVLKDGVDFLYKQSGYEKLDDVVMNILKFKEALKRQLSTMDDEETLDEDEEFYDEEETNNDDDEEDGDDE